MTERPKSEAKQRAEEGRQRTDGWFLYALFGIHSPAQRPMGQIQGLEPGASWTMTLTDGSTGLDECKTTWPLT